MYNEQKREYKMNERWCGCGKHIAQEPKAFYAGKWWGMKCLFRIADPRFPTLLAKFAKQRKQVNGLKTKLAKMKNFIKGLKCSSCSGNLGNRFVFLDQHRAVCGKCKTFYV